MKVGITAQICGQVAGELRVQRSQAGAIIQGEIARGVADGEICRAYLTLKHRAFGSAKLEKTVLLPPRLDDKKIFRKQRT